MQKMMSIVARRGFKQTLERTTRLIDHSPLLLQGKENCKVSKNIIYFIILVNIYIKAKNKLYQYNIDF